MINKDQFNYILLNEKYFYNITINSGYRHLINLYHCNIKSDKENNFLKFPNTSILLENKLNFLNHILKKLKYDNSSLSDLTLKMINNEFKHQRK